MIQINLFLKNYTLSQGFISSMAYLILSSLPSASYFLKLFFQYWLYLSSNLSIAA